MKTLIEKQAAAAVARQNSPSRLEAFATDSPPRQRRTTKPTPGGRTATVSDRSGGGGAVSQPHHRNSGGGVLLADLVSATTPPRGRGGVGPRIGSGFNIGVGVDGADGESARRSLARETYTKTFSGMQVLLVVETTRTCCFLSVENVPTKVARWLSASAREKATESKARRLAAGVTCVMRTLCLLVTVQLCRNAQNRVEGCSTLIPCRGCHCVPRPRPMVRAG